MIDLKYLTVLLPLLGFLFNGLLGPKIKNEKVIGIVGSGTIGLSFIIVVGAFFETLSLPVAQRLNIVTLFQWIAVAGLNISFSYQVDQLSLVMSLIVTGVGFIIHVYSIGYMHGDKSFWRFFAYLNLFIFAMMNLVLADNFFLLFLGWEGVGLCSYYLRDLLDVTDGNLGAHLRKLEEAGFIAVNKTFVERKPRTYVSATAEGRRVFQEHVAALESILKSK